LEQEEIDFLKTLPKKRKILLLLESMQMLKLVLQQEQTIILQFRLQPLKNIILEEYAKPMVGRSVQVNSVIFTKEDWFKNQQTEAKANLLVFPSKEKLNGHTGVKDICNMAKVSA
jgi:adenine-specific DNA-methyltransferase